MQNTLRHAVHVVKKSKTSSKCVLLKVVCFVSAATVFIPYFSLFTSYFAWIKLNHELANRSRFSLSFFIENEKIKLVHYFFCIFFSILSYNIKCIVYKIELIRVDCKMLFYIIVMRQRVRCRRGNNILHKKYGRQFAC